MRGWTLVFDLDGTLVDTAPDLAAATNHVLSKFNLAPVGERDIRPFVGHGALAMIAEALRSHGRKVSDEELHDLFEIFITHYTARIADNSRPYPGILAALDAYQERRRGACGLHQQDRSPCQDAPRCPRHEPVFLGRHGARQSRRLQARSEAPDRNHCSCQGRTLNARS